MAKPIKDTPILKGKNAEIFIKKINENINKKLDKNTMAEMKENFNKLKAIAQFR